ncbi:receptor-like protein kinase 7 [Hordeum vulgare subsp. vulgare]|uniref:Protein kinase domain-containing protein n=1 Tax=Hordeum vulgare subsp. vulgare TaxID=112509 RepID=A0A8I6XJE7_HORVV|nr:receptor-like protein kinase 7 [Hordeum vulgare subsp. vulgare]
MPPAGHFHLLLLLLSTLVHAASAATAPEVAALMAFKSSLTIPPAADAFFSSWDAAASSPCNFAGVTCRGTAVTALSVRDLNVSAASVPFGVLCGSLKSLAALSLTSNSLAGTIAGVDACVALRDLSLPFNSFSGKIPDLSPLAGLRTLNLSSNAFSGSFPWSALAAMQGLQVLSAGDNPYLTPTRSFPAEIFGLTNLTALYLSAANIVGPIPAGIGRLTELVDLELADNPLTGEIPRAISQLVNLQSLELYNCSLTGALPRGFGKLTKLQFFDASQNSLTGDLSELRSLTRLVSLQLFFNGLSGEVPKEFGDFKELVNLSLYTNNLTGELPRKLGSSSDVNFIDVSTNSLTGPIPPDMCKRGTMLKLLMLENNFSGEIPAAYASCTTLLRFRVSKNSLTGEVPEGLWALPKAEIIDLEGNQFTGGIGDGIGKAASLTSLLLAGNKFSGAIPSSIGDAGNLQSIDVSSNELSGEIPASIGKLVHLDSLDIAANGIGGAIPATLGSCSSLSTMNLAKNKLAGAIPSELRGLTRLNWLDMSSNELSGAVPAILAELKLSNLNLSDNRLDGPVPPGLAISAYGESFLGNPGLCANNGAGFLRRCTPGDGGRSGSTARTLVTCLLASMAVLLAVLGVVIFIKKRRQHAEAAAMAGGNKLLFAKKGSWNVKSFRMMAFDEREIVGGVRDENLIGSGGSGNVYRVKLGCGTVVAVKHITRTRAAAPASAAPTAAMLPRSASASARQCREFDAEVGTLSSIRHVNVVKLLCSVTSEDGAASLLVYEHLPNGSLYERLHGPTARKLGGLGWPERYEVAVGAARGLEYLHHGCGDRPILHRDVKSSNILLDEAFKPRIADFGLAKILDAGGKQGEPWSSSGGGAVAGTVGYMAPEYAYTRKVTEKSDVYSFGVVLMELATGRAAVADGEDVVEWASRRLDGPGNGRDKAMALLDASAAREEWEKEEAVRVLRVAVLCTSRTPAVRPSMRSVVQMLEDAAVGRECSGNGKPDDVEVVKVVVVP